MMDIDRIILARGSEANPGLCERVLTRFHEARVEYQPEAPPARVDLTPRTGTEALLGDPKGMPPSHSSPKRTLVLGRIGRVLDVNCEPGMGKRIVCYPYRHFNAVGNCPYDCTFCYLAGNRGNLKCPAIKLYTNLDEVLAALRKVADRASEPVLFYGSKLQDFVALDAITRYSETLIPFAAAHPNVRLLFLTKSADIETFLPLGHSGHTILSWTLNAEAVSEAFEVGAPPLQERLAAARRAADAGYEVRFIFMPMIPIEGWQEGYARAVRAMFAAVRPSRITLGGICMYRSALNAFRARLREEGTEAPWGDDCPAFPALQPPDFPRDRYRFPPEVRTRLYSHLLGRIREIDPSVPVSLCLETPEVWTSVGLRPEAAPCNCLL
ncbi:MAG: hypothetical protein FJX74_06785 [Armatimonadetes bacterium]|nr:hypothetical protein [Armatimonadota bacterium]